MFNLFKKKKNSLICGGVGEIEIVGQFNKYLGSIFYKRPEYSDKLAFELEFQAHKLDEVSLKKINQSSDAIIQTHNEIADKLYMPYAEKIFLRSEGFKDNKKPLSNYSRGKQFQILSKYYKNCLIELVESVFRVSTRSKKKS